MYIRTIPITKKAEIKYAILNDISSEIDTNKFWTPEKGWEAHPEWKCEDADADEFIRNSEHGGADGYPIKYFAEAILKDET